MGMMAHHQCRSIICEVLPELFHAHSNLSDAVCCLQLPPPARPPIPPCRLHCIPGHSVLQMCQLIPDLQTAEASLMLSNQSTRLLLLANSKHSSASVTPAQGMLATHWLMAQQWACP